MSTIIDEAWITPDIRKQEMIKSSQVSTKSSENSITSCQSRKNDAFVPELIDLDEPISKVSSNQNLASNCTFYDDEALPESASQLGRSNSVKSFSILPSPKITKKYI